MDLLAEYKRLLADAGFVQPKPYQNIFVKGQYEVTLLAGTGNGLGWSFLGQFGRKPETLARYLSFIGVTL